jgi:chaperone LolA
MKPATNNTLRRVLPLLFVALYSAALHAATLDQVLDTIQTKYQRLTTLSAKFTQTTQLELLNKTVTTTGTLQLKKPGKLRIDYDDARSKTYISNGKTLWVMDKATKQTDSFKIGSSEVPKEALTILNGFGAMRESYGVHTATANKDGRTTLRLVPMTATSYTALDATFRPDGILQKLAIHNRSGNISRYTFSDIQENPPLEDAAFNKP